MTSIEIVLTIFILILVVILIYHNTLIKLISKYIRDRQRQTNKIVRTFKKIYGVFQRIRRFSLVYQLKNRFYKFYLIIAIAVIITKFSFYYHPRLEESIWINKFIDFLIVSSAWEIICVITKIIDKKINKK